MRSGIATGALLFVLSVLLALVQLWFAPFSGELFVKLEMTIAALFLIVCVIAFIAREYREDRATRSGDRLDN